MRWPEGSPRCPVGPVALVALDALAQSTDPIHIERAVKLLPDPLHQLLIGQVQVLADEAHHSDGQAEIAELSGRAPVARRNEGGVQPFDPVVDGLAGDAEGRGDVGDGGPLAAGDLGTGNGDATLVGASSKRQSE